ncbi:MAG: peptidoglycan DD-metalloendopeptidase family protein [Proteobacteria bacterium]|nr:peptidoglycan DD-metalloendopeptidase family protein [Pseudomonadota bacterium]
MKKALAIILLSFYCLQANALLTFEDMKLSEGKSGKLQKKVTKKEQVKKIEAKQKKDILNQLKKISRAIGQLEKEISKNRKHSSETSSEIKKLEIKQDKIKKLLKKELKSFNQTMASILRLGNIPTEMIVIKDALSIQQKRSGVLDIYKKQLALDVEDSKKSLSVLTENVEEQKNKRLELIKIESRLKSKKIELNKIKKQQKLILKLPAEIRLRMQDDAVLLAKDLNLEKFLKKIRKKKLAATTSLAGLKLPIIGNITNDYHSKDRITELPIQGVIIEGGSRGKIKAMHDGRVIYSGQFREYGHLVILEHRTGAHSLYAGFGKSLVDVGDYVNSGDLLGVLPVEEEPTLYYEVRVNNKAESPKKWLEKDLNKA